MWWANYYNAIRGWAEWREIVKFMRFLSLQFCFFSSLRPNKTMLFFLSPGSGPLLGPRQHLDLLLIPRISRCQLHFVSSVIRSSFLGILASFVLSVLVCFVFSSYFQHESCSVTDYFILPGTIHLNELWSANFYF